MRFFKLVKLLSFVLVVFTTGCSDTKDEGAIQVEEINKWDETKTKWDNSKWD